MADYKFYFKVIYICDKENLKNMLSSNTICFNLIDKPYLFKKIPKHDKDLFVISFKIPQLLLVNKEVKYNKLSDEIYYITKDNLSLELIKDLIIFYKNDNQKEYISNLNKIYFNIKDSKEFELNLLKTKFNSNISYNDLNHLPIKNKLLKYKYEMSYDKYNKYKAVVYIFFLHNKEILEYYITNNDLYNHLNNSLKLNNYIQNNKSYKKELEKYNKVLIDALENEISNDVISFFSDNFLYVSDNGINLNLNKRMFNLSEKDFEFLNIILNGIIFKNLNKNNLLIFLKESLENFDQVIYKDTLYLNERFIENNYNINIKSIKNNISQNLYAYLENSDDLASLNNFSKNTNIKNPFISFMIFGAYTGFKNLTNSLVSKDLFTESDNKFINNNIKYIDQYFFKVSSNIEYIRTKLYYLILLVLNNIKLTNITFDYASMLIKENMLIISDPYNNLDLYIEYFVNTRSLSANSSNKYELALKLGNSKLIQNNSFIFSYYFKYKPTIKKSKKELHRKIALDIDSEQDYIYILEYLYNQLK